MDELLKALTRAANAVAEYYEKQSNPLLPLINRMEKVAAAVQENPEIKTRKPRAPKAEAAAEQPSEKPAAAAPAEMTEADSLKEVRAVAKVYVQRFANQVDGIKAFRDLMAATCKVGKIDDLQHAQRLQMIVAAKAEINKADKPAAASPVGAGVEV